MIKVVKQNTFWLFVIAMGCVGCAVFHGVMQECDQRNQIPAVEIYPGSEMNEQNIQEYRNLRMATTSYTVTATFERVVSFYAQYSDCRVDNLSTYTICVGDLTDPEGTYYVYIAQGNSQNVTTYSVEVHWRGCSKELHIHISE